MRFSWKPLTILGTALALCAGLAVSQPGNAAADLDAPAWAELNKKVKRAFFPLPMKKMFANSKAERSDCKKAPDAAGALEKRALAREKRNELRQDYKSVREARTELVAELLRADDSRALEALARALKYLNADLKALAKTIEEYEKAAQTFIAIGGTIQYGNVKGEQEWHKWAQAELAVALEFRDIEIRVKNVILNGFAKVEGGGGMAWFRDELAKNKSEEVRAGAALALGANDSDGNVAALAGAYDKEKDGLVRVAIIDGLFQRRAKDQQDVFLRALADSVWEVRSAAVFAIDGFEYRDVKTVEALIEGLVKEDGRLRGEFEDALNRLTNQRFFGDGLLWRKWWGDNKAQWAAANGEGATPDAGEPKKDGDGSTDFGGGGGYEKPKEFKSKAEFYGIKTFSNRIVFILDRSGSMKEKSGEPPPPKGGPQVSGGGHKKGPDEPQGGPKGDRKVDTARWELEKAVMGLSSDVMFTIIFYNNGVEIWHEELQKATRANKMDALKYIADLEPEGSTNIGDAMKRGFGVGMPGAGEVQDSRYAKGESADTIFLLSDGSPTTPDGKLVDTNLILEDVRNMNKLRRIVIHTIGIGKGDNRAFMGTLASENKGTYVHRD